MTCRVEWFTQVHTFRMALFAAHLGGHHDAFLQPSRLSLVDRPTELICISDIYLSTDKYKRQSRAICEVELTLSPCLSYPVTTFICNSYHTVRSAWQECGKWVKGSSKFTRRISLPSNLSTSTSFHTQFRFSSLIIRRNVLCHEKTRVWHSWTFQHKWISEYIHPSSPLIAFECVEVIPPAVTDL